MVHYQKRIVVVHAVVECFVGRYAFDLLLITTSRLKPKFFKISLESYLTIYYYYIYSLSNKITKKIAQAIKPFF